MRHAGYVTVGLLIAVLSAPLSAQTVPSNYRFVESLHSGHVLTGFLMSRTGSLDLGPEPAVFFGGLFDRYLTGPISGEVALGLSPTQRTVYRFGGAGNPLIVVGEARMLLVRAEAGLRFHITGPRTWHGLAPYVVGSGGVVLDMAQQSALSQSLPASQRFKLGPGFAAGVGLGSDFYLTDRISLRAEARDHIWRLKHPEGLTQNGEEKKEWLQNFAITIGGSYHF